MRLLLKRIAYKETYTIGELFIDGQYFSDTLEDKVREDGIKIYGETAIPKGEYQVIINHSNRFNRPMPLLLDVPNFNGIRIHSGNTNADTSGCILIGINSEIGKISKSSQYFIKLFNILENSESKITIKII